MIFSIHFYKIYISKSACRNILSKLEYMKYNMTFEG